MASWLIDHVITISYVTASAVAAVVAHILL